MMARQQAAAADAEFRVALRCQYALDHFHSRPDTAGILPAASRAAQPFAQNRPASHQAALILRQGSRQRPHLAGGAHRYGDDGGQQIGGNRQARAFGNSPDVGNDLQAVARHAGQRGQNVGQRLARPFQSRRDDAGGDDSGFEQSQIVARKIEDLSQGRDVGGGIEVDAGEAKYWLVDRPEEHIDGWLRTRFGGTAQGQIDGDVEHPRAFRVIHAEEKDIAPAAVAEVHANRGRFAEDRKSAAPAGTVEQFAPENQRIVGRMPDAGHPLVAAHGAHAAADLGRQRLECEPLISRGQRARKCRGRAAGRKSQQHVNSFTKTALEDIRDRVRRHRLPGRHAGFVRQMETMNRI